MSLFPLKKFAKSFGRKQRFGMGKGKMNGAKVAPNMFIENLSDNPLSFMLSPKEN